MALNVFALACVFLLSITMVYAVHKLRDALYVLIRTLVYVAQTIEAGACEECVHAAHDEGMHKELELN